MLINGDDIEKASWFPDAQLNYAENLLQMPSDEVAIYFKAEDKRDTSLTYKQLHNQVAIVASWLKSEGIVKGDQL